MNKSPTDLAAKVRELINEICLDSLECPLQSLLDHREHEEKQQVSSLFLQLYDTFNALVAERNEAERIARVRSDQIESFADKLHAAEAERDEALEHRYAQQSIRMAAEALAGEWQDQAAKFAAMLEAAEAERDSWEARVAELEKALRDLLDVDGWVNDFGTAEFQAAAAALRSSAANEG